MSDGTGEVDLMVRRAIGGDVVAIAWFLAHADTASDPSVVVMAALLEGRPDRLDQALALASSSRDRQVVAIAGARLRGDDDLVDALARDHLVDHPDNFLVAWIASDAAGGTAGRQPR